MTTMEELERRIRENERRHPTVRPARRWEWYEERINPTVLTIGGGTPAAGTRAFDTGGIVLGPTIDFSYTVAQGVRYVWHAPEDLNRDQPITVHVMWVPGASWTSGNYVMHIYYIVANENASLPVAAYTLQALDVTPANATDVIESKFPSGITIQPDQLFAFYFYRSTASDTGNDVLQLLFLEIEYARWLDGRRPDVPMELSR